MPYRRARAIHALGYALLASIVLHASLLAVEWPQVSAALKRPVQALAPLVARLVEPAPPPPSPAGEEKPQLQPKPSPVPGRKTAPAPAPRAEPERVAETPPAMAAPAPAPVPAPAPPPPASSAKAAPPAPAPPQGNTPSLVTQYRAALLAEAGRHKRYPPVALDNGWEGQVVVRMAIAADGSLASLDVRSSSGHAALDRQALEMFRKARAGVPLPDALRGKQFTLELRAVFNLRDRDAG